MVLTHMQIYSELYKILSLALYLPDEDLVNPVFLETLKDLSAQLDLKVAGPISELERFYAGPEARLTDLEIEYSRLFVGPFSLPVPPYESCFREKGKVMGDTTMAVARFYQETGFETDSEFKEPPDHIALETNFLAELCDLESKFDEQENSSLATMAQTRQLEFLETHLLLWADDFLEAVRQRSSLIFYPAIVGIMVETARAHYGQLVQSKV